jgi:hypothetical protein
MRPVEQDINLRVATEDSVDLLWAGSVNVWLSTRAPSKCRDVRVDGVMGWLT